MSAREKRSKRPVRTPVRWVAMYAAVAAAVPVALSVDRAEVQPEPVPQLQRDVEPPEQVQALAGVWWRYEAGSEGDPVRFYYFHGDGKGLYRYGKVGLTNTQSFDYDVVGHDLELRFRKTGGEHTVRFRVEYAQDPRRDGGVDRDWLVLNSDPQESGTSTRYYRERRGPIEHQPPAGLGDLGPAPAGHLWIDHRQFATGGHGFSMYQFRPAGIDGRGVGWFHRGDFDDWSTESLVYRITGNRIELLFSVREEWFETGFVLEGEGDQRALTIAVDPRDYWHSHRYQDAGPSFGSVGPGLGDAIWLPPQRDPGYSRTP